MKNKEAVKKVDLRFNDTKEAVQEISRVIKECPLTNDALALLISNMGSGISKTQVLCVLNRIPELETKYFKQTKQQINS